MLRTRVITAVVLLVVIAGAAAWSATALRVLLAALAGVAMYEWMKLAGRAEAGSLAAAIVCGAVLAGASVLDIRAPDRVTAGVSLAASLVWCGLGATIARAERGPVRIGPGVSSALALALLAAGWMAMDSLLQRGAQWLVSVLAVVWIADIAAYFTGRAFGRHKLAPRTSPGKTWEGVYGALGVVTMGALIARGAWPQAPLWSSRILADLAWPWALAALWAAVALSIVGDLFESLLKRQAQVKDSGRLLPGHGGVLDRIDATLPVLPAAVLIDWWTR
jgi:phosphatidate cytidylyltransferase